MEYQVLLIKTPNKEIYLSPATINLVDGYIFHVQGIAVPKWITINKKIHTLFYPADWCISILKKNRGVHISKCITTLKT